MNSPSHPFISSSQGNFCRVLGCRMQAAQKERTRARPQNTSFPLPFELISDMAHFLCDGGQSVSACMLTCRIWRDACRPYIYRSISISTPRRYKKFLSLLDAEPTVGNFVEKLSVQLVHHLHFSLSTVFYWVCAMPGTLGTRLQNVTNLHLGRIQTGTSNDHSLLVCHMAFTSLKSLSIDSCSVSILEIGKFANELRHLEEIHISNH